MSQQSLATFLATVQQDDALMAQFGQVTEVDQLIALAAEHGCCLTVEDIQSLASSFAEAGELDDAALATVAGGVTAAQKQAVLQASAKAAMEYAQQTLRLLMSRLPKMSGKGKVSTFKDIPPYANPTGIHI